MTTTTYPRAVVLSALFTLGVVRAAPLDRPAMLRAIAEVETGNNPRAIGDKGERSAWQIGYPVWSEITIAPFEWATSDPAWARRVAEEHLDRIIRKAARRWRVVTPAMIAHAWNPLAPADYARRVVNLYQDFCQQQPNTP